MSETIRLNPPGDIWRVDVAGVACRVKGEVTKRHLESVNSQLARMRLALFKIAKAASPQADDIDEAMALAEVNRLAREAINDRI